VKWEEHGRVVSEVTAAAFASTIADVLNLADGGRAIAAKAQDTVRQRFDRAVLGQKLSSIYADVLGAG
jgi:hypothetical protein